MKERGERGESLSLPLPHVLGHIQTTTRLGNKLPPLTTLLPPLTITPSESILVHNTEFSASCEIHCVYHTTATHIHTFLRINFPLRLPHCAGFLDASHSCTSSNERQTGAPVCTLSHTVESDPRPKASSLELGLDTKPSGISSYRNPRDCGWE